MDLFTYGTLTLPALMAVVAGSDDLHSVPASLPDFAVRPVQNDVVPFVIHESGSVAQGVLWQGLTDEQIARLTAYEGAFGYELAFVDVLVSGALSACHCYLPHVEIRAGQGEWSLDKWTETHLMPAILAAKEVFSHDSLPDQAALHRMWPMIEGRAWAKYRAGNAPATLRHDAKPEDFEVVTRHPPHGSFFRLQSLDVTHRRFDGEKSDVLSREAFFGVDAAILLPYDPIRDRILLVEQTRVGPAARQDPNPWMLEPIAGIVDARETPDQAARREALEEAGLELKHLEPAGTYYPSPGSSTDYFYSYVGLCDLPMSSSYLGGLDDEAEDLRLHPIDRENAMVLASSGEIAAGPLLHLLYWLAYHRDRLCAMDI